MRAKRKGPTREKPRAAASAAGRDPRIKPAPGPPINSRGRLRPNGGRLQHTGGSPADDQTDRVASETGQALSVRDPEAWTRVAPKLGAEHLIAAQLIAIHGAAMACYRGAMAGPDGRRRHANLSQACRLTRAFTRLVDALDRRRPNASPKPAPGLDRGVTVLHLHVHAPDAGAGPVARPALPAPAKSAE
jgi:hypothetical protein